jgi:DNA damage-binding protein 1
MIRRGRGDLLNLTFENMKVVTTFHSASSVVDSLKFRLADEQASEFLIVAKLNRLDIYSLLPEGLRHEQGLDIWGRVRAIKAVPLMVSNG